MFLTDEEVVRLAQEGDRSAFEVLYGRHCRAAFSLACRISGRSTAEDVVQEAFLSLWQTDSLYSRQRGNVRTWVLSIVRNRAVDRLRRTRPADRLSTEYIDEFMKHDGDDTTDRQVIQADEAEQVRAVVRTLPLDQRKVIELAYFGGFSHTEITQLLGLPLGTVKGRMRLGLKKMADELA